MATDQLDDKGDKRNELCIRVEEALNSLREGSITESIRCLHAYLEVAELYDQPEWSFEREED